MEYKRHEIVVTASAFPGTVPTDLVYRITRKRDGRIHEGQVSGKFGSHDAADAAALAEARHWVDQHAKD